MRNILIWTIVGCVVAGFWAIYAAATLPSSSMSADPILRAIINVTCPIAFASFHFHFGVKLYWAVTANAATYGLIAFAVEALRKQLKPVS